MILDSLISRNTFTVTILIISYSKNRICFLHITPLGWTFSYILPNNWKWIWPHCYRIVKKKSIYFKWKGLIIPLRREQAYQLVNKQSRQKDDKFLEGCCKSQCAYFPYGYAIHYNPLSYARTLHYRNHFENSTSFHQFNIYSGVFELALITEDLWYWIGAIFGTTFPTKNALIKKRQRCAGLYDLCDRKTPCRWRRRFFDL